MNIENHSEKGLHRIFNRMFYIIVSNNSSSSPIIEEDMIIEEFAIII
jgi:hypothetical protein